MNRCLTRTCRNYPQKHLCDGDKGLEDKTEGTHHSEDNLGESKSDQ